MDVGGGDVSAHIEASDQSILELLTAGSTDGIVKYERKGSPTAVSITLQDDCKTLECRYEGALGLQQERIVLADVQAFHYGLNTQSVFSHNELRSEAFEEISNMSFYLIYALNPSDPSGSNQSENAPRSNQSSLNLTATTSQSCALWSNLCGLTSVWKILANPQKDLLRCSRATCQHPIKVSTLLTELVRRNAVDGAAAIKALAFLLDFWLQGSAEVDERTLQKTLLRLCDSLTTIFEKDSPPAFSPFSKYLALVEEVRTVLCRHLLRSESWPAVQKAASSALQKLSRQLHSSGRLGVHASVLAVLSQAAGHLSTESIVSLLDLLADNASVGGYLTQQSAQDLRLLALVKDQDLRTAASRTLAALPVVGSILTASEMKFAFLEKTLLPLPVLKRESQQEPSATAPDRSELTVTSATAVAADESPEKQILVSPYPFAPCGPAARQLFKSSDDDKPLAGRLPATEGLRQGPRAKLEPGSCVSIDPNPIKRAAPARSPLSPRSPSSFSRSRDLARVVRSLPKEHRAISPPAKNPKRTPTGSVKTEVFSKEKAKKDTATRSPLQEVQRGSGGDKGLVPTPPFDRSQTPRTLGQVASQFEARKEVWKETAARKRDTMTKIVGSDASKAVFLAAGMPDSLPREGSSGGGIEGDVQKKYGGLQRQVEWVNKSARADGSTVHQSLAAEDGRSHISNLQWDALSIEEWLQLAALEEDSSLAKSA